MKQTALFPHVQAALDAAAITYEVFVCDPALADTAAFCEKYGFTPDQSANTIIVGSRGVEPVVYACCVVLATCRLDVNGAVRRLMGVRKASFAPMDDALALTGMEYGGVTAFGVPEDMPVYIDAAVMSAHGPVVMGGGNRSSKVLVQPGQLHKIPHVQVVEGLAKG
jgi:prolyl-tRNA editing enzyme YbaK/EbsC (Cys-tRNA(Pro) deacylase)